MSVLFLGQKTQHCKAGNPLAYLHGLRRLQPQHISHARQEQWIFLLFFRKNFLKNPCEQKSFYIYPSPALLKSIVLDFFGIE